ncbi:hypothetical protein [Mycobacterium shinjukuense]|nr:hypothetical protein [Mycobacterium shinjukuense]
MIAAMLAVSLLFAGAFLAVARFHSSPSDVLDHPANPVSDDATRALVVEAAKHVVTVAGLQTTTAGYLLMSCKNRDDPPYQGAVYLTFVLPAGARADTYFRTAAAALTTHGWTEGLPPSDQVFGKTLSKGGVTAILHRHDADTGMGVLRLYGQCRNITDHRRDPTGWIDITGELTLTVR